MLALEVVPRNKPSFETPQTILQALLAALQSVPGATVLRGAILPECIPTGGLLILRDDDPGTPEVMLLEDEFEAMLARAARLPM